MSILRQRCAHIFELQVDDTRENILARLVGEDLFVFTRHSAQTQRGVICVPIRWLVDADAAEASRTPPVIRAVVLVNRRHEGAVVEFMVVVVFLPLPNFNFSRALELV